MKKLLIASAVAAAVAAPAAFADSDFTIYGKAHLAIDSRDVTGGASTTDLVSRASRLGIKGKTEIAVGLTGLYKWEVQVAQDGESSELKQRNQFVGLKGGFGTVIAGIHDTPMKQAEGKVDVFSDREDIGNVLKKYVDTQEREKNFVGYYSPKFGMGQLAIATMPGAGSELGDAFSVSFTHGDKKLKKAKYFAAIAYDDGVDTSEDASAIRLTGQTKVGPATLGAIIENADNGTNDHNRYVVSGKVKVAPKTSLLAQYVKAEELGGTPESDNVTLGLDHKLGKNTKVYVMGGKSDITGTETDYFSVGMDHKFKF